ncbi:MAG TPA: HAD family hydrolase, partial [Acidobacteriaceae bacterium]|nr:HAD family hydrolase [Acidobacteriaceae bacterium]
MKHQGPTLIADIGNTLISRSRPGTRSRVISALTEHGIVLEDDHERTIGKVIFTAPDLDACERSLAGIYPELRKVISDALHEPAGSATILPGAREVVSSATAAGWRVIAATNAAAGTPSLPSELDGVSGIAWSAEYGVAKDDPRFWRMLLEREQVSPQLALVVGDSPRTDREVPRAVGLQTLLVQPDGCTLTTLAADLATAGPMPPGTAAVIVNDGEQWAGRPIVTAPHLESLVVRVTRSRHRLVTGDGRACWGQVVRRKSLPPAVISEADHLPGVSWLLNQRER